MFVKIWQLIILYIDRMDWGAGHLTTTERTGDGTFANKNARGFAWGGRVMLAAGTDLHITIISNCYV